MKIIQLLYSLSSGGAERFVVDLSNQLAAWGEDVVICMLRPEQGMSFGRRFVSPLVRVESLGLQPGFSLDKIRSVERFLARERPDVVHCHLNVVPYVYRWSLWYRHKMKFFHTLHNVAEKTVGGRLQYRINRYFYFHRLIVPVCISSLCKQSYLDYYKAEDVTYIDNGREPVSPTSAIDAVKAEVLQYKQREDSLVFVHVARYNPQKNQEMLIEAFNLLNERGRDFVLLVIGNGFDCEGGRKLMDKACEKIHFLGEKHNVGDYLLCSDAFCLTSHFEGLPISLLEALSCGVTPICTSVGGIPDVIEDGKTGYLTSVDRDAYLAAVEHFMRKPIDSARLKALFERRFSMAECARKYLDLYKH